RSNFATWLYRITFNCSVDYMRARPHRETAETDDRLEQLSGRSQGPSTHDLAYAGEIGERVQEALETLSPQERAAFLMRHYQGCSIEAMCSALVVMSRVGGVRRAGDARGVRELQAASLVDVRASDDRKRRIDHAAGLDRRSRARARARAADGAQRSLPAERDAAGRADERAR